MGQLFPPCPIREQRSYRLFMLAGEPTGWHVRCKVGHGAVRG
jgi:hypothetical protein